MWHKRFDEKVCQWSCHVLDRNVLIHAFLNPLLHLWPLQIESNQASFAPSFDQLIRLDH